MGELPPLDTAVVAVGAFTPSAPMFSKTLVYLACCGTTFRDSLSEATLELGRCIPPGWLQAVSCVEPMFSRAQCGRCSRDPFVIDMVGDWE